MPRPVRSYRLGGKGGRGGLQCLQGSSTVGASTKEGAATKRGGRHCALPEPAQKRNKKCQAAPAVLPLTQGGGAVCCSQLQGSSASGAGAIHALLIGKEGATVRCRSQCAASPSSTSKPSAPQRPLPRRHGLRGGGEGGGLQCLQGTPALEGQRKSRAAPLQGKKKNKGRPTARCRCQCGGR